jgi:GTPase SAR1 family protein
MNQPNTYEMALSLVQELSRFWQFKRKKLAADLTGHITESQEQLGSVRDKYLEGIDALCQAQINIKSLQERQSVALKKIGALESLIESQKTELLVKEQHVSMLEELTSQLKHSHASLETNYEDISQQHLSLRQKSDLIKNILAQEPAHNLALTKFAQLINDDYMNFAGREASLAEEAQAMVEIQGILSELQMIMDFPSISGKRILGVAGGFSSGKSAFVNSFIKNQAVQLATGLNPVTVVPSYVICSEQVRIRGYSYSGGSIELDSKLYASLSHEYVKTFGFDLRRILPFICVDVPLDTELFEHLCVIDTPGYNPGSDGAAQAADRRNATSLVKQASALIWVIGLDPAGTILQSDIEFIQSTPFRSESLYIVLNKADVKSQSDIESIMKQVGEDLEFADIDYAGMYAYSSIQKKSYGCLGQSFADFLRSINRHVDITQEISNKIDAIFDRYNSAIQFDINEINTRRSAFNNFKMDALEIGGTALLDRMEKVFPETDNTFATSELVELLNECEILREKLKKGAREILA